MLTLREAMSLPVFSTSRLVAGATGVDNEINWVHIVDIPEAHYEWQRRGVLLLTAGYGLRDNPERMATFIPKLVEQGFAGMVLAVGYYFDSAPEPIQEAAERLGFPIIEAPRDILFIEITEAILERIVNRQYTLLQRSSAISEELTQLVLRGAGLNDLATTLADLIGRSVTIEDASFRIIANAQVGPVDAGRLESVERGRTPPELSQRLVEAGIYERLLSQMGPVRLPPIPGTGMEMERLVAPIIVDREIYGYIWVILDGPPPSELDERAIVHAATVAALMIFKDKAVRRAEEAQRGDLLERLLQGALNSAGPDEQARRLQFRPERPQQVFLVRGESAGKGSSRTLPDAIEAWLATRSIAHLAAWRGDRLVLVIEGGRGVDGKEIAARLHADLDHPGSRLLVSVGRLCSPEEIRREGVRRSYDEANEASEIALATGAQHGVTMFEELGLLHWLYQLPPQVAGDSIFTAAVTRLAAHDAERNAELLKTLEAFLAHNGSLVETAESLYIHRNTLLHRLERIKTLCGMDLRSAWQRLNLFAALKAYQLGRFRDSER